jgi:DNA-3-methyladenine glycosylase
VPDPAAGVSPATLAPLPAALEGARLLGRDFFDRDALTVARDLVGALLLRPDEGLAARVVETEAYTADDPACHAYRRRTERNAPLWGPPGHAYVYRSYGVHWCLNVATGTDGVPEGCLLRAAEPLAGLTVFRARRGPKPTDRDLLRGPGRLGQAFGLDGRHSGRDICAEGATLRLASDGATPQVLSGPRVGVSQAADHPWRFHEAGSRWVSAYSRSPRAPRARPS